MKERKNISEEKYSTILNGRVDFSKSAKNPLARRQITYENVTTGKMQTQNYIQMQDVVVPVILRHNEKGEVEFAAIYEYVPATKQIMFELPECPFFDIKKAEYSPEETIDCVNNALNNYGLKMDGIKWLDKQETPVSQSITDQQALFVAVYTSSDNASEELKWFPISSIKECLDKVKSNSSLQTKYALQLFYRQHKDIINKQKPHKFVLPDIIGQPVDDWKDTKNIMENKYRFGIEFASKEATNELSEKEENYAEYIQSRNSANCLLVKQTDKGLKVGLAKQLRSPFIEREGVEDNLFESVGGMVDGNESYLEAVQREAIEETGYNTNNAKLIHVSEPTISSKAAEEHSDYYIFFIDENNEPFEQKLDEDEAIDTLQWFDLDEVDNIRMPLSTKYLLELLKYELTKEKEKEIEFER